MIAILISIIFAVSMIVWLIRLRQKQIKEQIDQIKKKKEYDEELRRICERNYKSGYYGTDPKNIKARNLNDIPESLKRTHINDFKSLYPAWGSTLDYSPNIWTPSESSSADDSSGFGGGGAGGSYDSDSSSSSSD